MNTTRGPAVPRGIVILLIVLWLVSVFGLNYGNYAGATAEGVAGLELWGMLLVNSLLIAIPTGLLFFSIALLIAVYHQKHAPSGLSPRLAKFVYYTPRIAAVLLILFLTLFSFDVFEMGGSPLEMLRAFLMHSVPSMILAVILILAWRNEWIGAVLFMAAALFFLVFFYSDPLDSLGLLLIIAGPLIVIAILFWLNWQWKDDLRAQSAA